jgi:hypothetical protein
MIEGMLRAAKDPEVKRKRSEAALRSWLTRDRQEKRELLSRLRRERPAEFMDWRYLPENRKRMQEMSRARWAVPAYRERMLYLMRQPEAQRRKSLGQRRYYEEHPEARKRVSDMLRRLWRDPAHRRRRIQSLRVAMKAVKRGGKKVKAGEI